MATGALGVHDGLRSSGRVPTLARADVVSWVELLTLVLMGAGTAALSLSLPDFHLRIPGNAILRAVFPMALGLALVPRRLGGCVMGGSALVTGLVLQSTGIGRTGVGAVTSLCLTGPLLDLALWGARSGWRLYLGFVLAGLSSNLIAFAVRAGARLMGVGGSGGGGGGGGGGGMGGGGGGGMGMGGGAGPDWWINASISYPLCGLAAGLVSAAVWFHFRRRKPATNKEAVP
jgi:hypothetical protein